MGAVDDAVDDSRSDDQMQKFVDGDEQVRVFHHALKRASHLARRLRRHDRPP
ncbi:MAG: hypothetical protein M3P26_04350 [Gemmatimonadota bacterium]|nr:hypothetical protein [Gemmatimonadota bacterium]